MSAQESEIIVRRYFDEVVDGRSAEAVEELFAPDCMVMRADVGRPMHGRETVRRFVAGSIKAVPKVTTEIDSLIANENGDVAVRVRHEAQFGPIVITPIGPVVGLDRRKPVRWSAIATFKVKGGRITEEYVVRDELAILRDMGLSTRLRRMGRSAIWNGLRRMLGLSNSR